VAGSAFYDISGSGGFKDIVIINAVLGISFLIVALIEIVGFLAALKQTLTPARLYAYLSLVSTLLAIAAKALRFSVYFTHKQTLIDNCTHQATGATVETYGGFLGRYTDQTLDAAQAQSYCDDSWTKSVWSSVLWMFFSIFLSLLYISLAFSFYHQLLALQQMAPSQAYNMNNFQQPYSPQSAYRYPAGGTTPKQRKLRAAVRPRKGSVILRRVRGSEGEIRGRGIVRTGLLRL